MRSERNSSTSNSLRTERLVLEPWQENRLSDLVRLSSDPVVMRYIGSGEVWGREKAIHMHTGLLAHWKEHDFGWRTLRQQDSDRVIGVVGLNYTGPEAIEIPTPEIEIGWWLDPQFWGRGYATEAAIAVRDDGFARLDLERVIGRHQAANPASGRIMERIGMSFEREAPGRYGQTVRIWGLSRARWVALH